MLTYGTMCSGIGAPECAFDSLGWKCRFQSEIDKAACKVLKSRFPGVPNLGDITRLRPEDIPEVDLWVAGTPCQDFSVAGRREGKDGKHGNLTEIFTGLVRECRPRYVLWENVPGVLSSDGGLAFGGLLSGMVGGRAPMVPPGGRWPSAGMARGPAGIAAWRILDAQFFGVPQRRRRVFVFARRAGAGGAHPGEVLFEPQGMCGDIAQGGKAGKEVADTIGSRFRAGREDLDSHGAYVVETAQPLVSSDSRRSYRPGANYVVETAQPLVSSGGYMKYDTSRDNYVVEDAFAFKPSRYTRDKDGAPASVYPPLTAAADRGVHDAGRVRRLMPIEWERLQGFPDGWTAPAGADSPRYRCIGNSMAVPVLRWLAWRIGMTEASI